MRYTGKAIEAGLGGLVSVVQHKQGVTHSPTLFSCCSIENTIPHEQQKTRDRYRL